MFTNNYTYHHKIPISFIANFSDLLIVLIIIVDTFIILILIILVTCYCQRFQDFIHLFPVVMVITINATIAGYFPISAPYLQIFSIYFPHPIP